MKYAVVLAGGIGKRMKCGEMPKQFLKIGGREIIVWTIEKIVASELFDRIIIAIHPDWAEYLEKLLKENSVNTSKISITSGGKERIDSISNSIKFIEENYGIHEDDKILIHGAVRPFVTKEVLEDSIDAVSPSKPAVVAVAPAVDTMIMADEEGKVVDIPDRSKVFHGQEPESFSLPIFKKALDSLTEEERGFITGTTQICFVKGIPVYTTKGDPNNIKITVKKDLAVAEAILEEGLKKNL